MLDYQIQPNTRRCAVNGRELQPGEKFYTVLIEEGIRFVRQDYSAEAWKGPPEGAFSFWAGHVPKPQSRRRLIVDDAFLHDCFLRLEGQGEPAKVNFRYILALLLMRRRRFKFEETRQEGGLEVLCLRCARTGDRHEVVNPRLTEEEMRQVQEDVFCALGGE